MDRERSVSTLFIDLSDTLVSDFDLPDLLDSLVTGCTDVLKVDAAGVMLARSVDQLALSAASSEEMRVLELFELQSRTGPCYSAYVQREQIAVTDLAATRDRWPEFVPRALELGFRSGHAFPLRLRGSAIGALNLFRESTEPLADDDVHLGQSLADVATIGILQERSVSDAQLRAAQLQRALDSRVLIEQAKGMLAERMGIEPTAAFNRIRSYARSRNMKLRDVCRRIADEGFTPLG